MGSITQLWNFGGEVLDDSHVNMDCGPKVQGQCGGQKSSKRLLTLIKEYTCPERVWRENRGAWCSWEGEGRRTVVQSI